MRQLLKTGSGPFTKLSTEMLQRSIGNSAITSIVGQNMIQRDEYDDPEDFIPWFQKQDVYIEWLSNVGGDCAPSAKAIGTFLVDKFKDTKNVTVRYRGISFLSPFGHRGAKNLPHFVVTVSWAGKTIVIDTTQEQFAGGKNQIADDANWEAGFASLPTIFADPEVNFVSAVTPKVYTDFATFDEANQFVKDNQYKTSEDNQPVGKKLIGNWVDKRVPYVKAAPVLEDDADSGSTKEKKKSSWSFFGKKKK
ncbi:MAG: hypothetical protein H0X30_00305 [Anaerolineae bacterium]|nr:hypothetical protein [Anaerolineae bacterium]